MSAAELAALALKDPDRMAEAMDFRDAPMRRRDFDFEGSKAQLIQECLRDRNEGNADAHIYFWNDTRLWSVWRVQA